MREAFFEIERLRGLMIFSAGNEEVLFAIRRKSNVMIWDGAEQLLLFLGGLSSVPEKRVRDDVAPNAKCDNVAGIGRLLGVNDVTIVNGRVCGHHCGRRDDVVPLARFQADAFAALYRDNGVAGENPTAPPPAGGRQSLETPYAPEIA